MAKKPTTDVSTYSKPANLPGFLVELMLSFLVVRGLVKGSTGVNGEAGKMFRHTSKRRLKPSRSGRVPHTPTLRMGFLTFPVGGARSAPPSARSLPVLAS